MPEDRSHIQNTLQCPVANEYGSVEAGLFAYECPSGSMHTFEESNYLYTNENNELISTELHNWCTPLINYNTGDKITFSKSQCKCGRTLKIIKNIEGRTGDTILKSNGEELSQYFFYYFFKYLHDEFQHSIMQYKIIQNNMTFDIYYVSGNNKSEIVLHRLKEKMYNEIGKEILINFIKVNSIPKEKSGKIRFFYRV